MSQSAVQGWHTINDGGASGMRVCGGVSVLAILVAVTTKATAAPLSPVLIHSTPSASETIASVVPVVVFGNDARELPKTFAVEHRLNASELVRNHAASGLIQCGNAHGAGQLTLADDVVTTAAHVFFDENGLQRARSCSFNVMMDGHEIQTPIDLSSIVAGSKNPYDAAVAHDWAVARLTRPVSGAKPYAIANDVHEDEPITFVARGHIDWGEGKQLSMQDCMMHDQLSRGEEGTREFSFDCDTGDGASGGAVMVTNDYMRIGAILVGWRSNQPFKSMPFSHTHYNFAVTMEGGFRQAVVAAAGKVLVQK